MLGGSDELEEDEELLLDQLLLDDEGPELLLDEELGIEDELLLDDGIELLLEDEDELDELDEDDMVWWCQG